MQNASEGLQTMLEGIADHRLAPQQLSGSAIRIEVAAEELRPQKERIERLSEVLRRNRRAHIGKLESEIRLLIRIPDEHLRGISQGCSEQGVQAQLLESGGLLGGGLNQDWLGMIAVAFALEFESVCFCARHDPRLRVGVWLLGAMGAAAALEASNGC